MKKLYMLFLKISVESTTSISNEFYNAQSTLYEKKGSGHFDMHLIVNPLQTGGSVLT